MVHPDRLLDQLTSRQLSEWEAYDRIDPIGTWREDFRVANLMALVQNIASSLYGKKNEIRWAAGSDYMPDWDGEREVTPKHKQTVEEMKQVFIGISKARSRLNVVNIKPPKKH